MMIPTWLQALVLGIVQGLTEFIPISSSGHLVLVPYLLGWERPGLAFDVALHMGTIGAIGVYFRCELFGMVRGLLLGSRTPDGSLYRRLALLLVVASVPVAIVGLTLEDVVEDVFGSPLATSLMLFVTAAILIGGEQVRDRRVARSAPRTPGEDDADADGPVWTGDWIGGRLGASETAVEVAAPALPIGDDPADPEGRTLEGVGLREAVIIGVGQTLALFPGISRSGTTIMAGVAAGLTREAATRFSFLLALPALMGAGILKLGDLAEPGIYSGTDIALGVTASFVSGYLAIRFLVALVSRERLTGFARYVIVAGIIGVVGYLMIGPISAV
jgi:undecaprenyl-diphosphatase